MQLGGKFDLPEILLDRGQRPDELPEPKTKPGDIYILGRHRLMCGDSTMSGDVDQLLDGEKPRLMVTDPPYGVNYDPDWRNRELDKLQWKVNRSVLPVTLDTSSTHWAGALRCYRPEVIYVWSPMGADSIRFGQCIEGADYQIRSMIIWRKTTFVISRGHYHYQHEPCWYAVRKGVTAKWLGGRGESTIWDIKRDKHKGGGHSTRKPMECMERPIRNHEGDVYDPFVGSGTTIIASERTGRRCFAMELEPYYVDIAVARWEAYTLETAQKVAGRSTSALYITEGGLNGKH